MRGKDVKVGTCKAKHPDRAHCSLRASKEPNGPLPGSMKGWRTEKHPTTTARIPCPASSNRCWEWPGLGAGGWGGPVLWWAFGTGRMQMERWRQTYTKNLHRRPCGSLEDEHILAYWMDLCARISLSSQKRQEPEHPVKHLVISRVHGGLSNVSIWQVTVLV